MHLDDLIGLKFKYISPYSKKECDLVGVVKNYTVVQSFDKDFKYFNPEIHIISESGSACNLTELIFFK